VEVPFNVMLEEVWSTRKNIVIMGDLNSDLSLKRQEAVESHLSRRLTHILNTYGLQCVIREPTRISDKTQTLIDLIIVSHAESITTAGVTHLGISHQSFVYANEKRKIHW